MGKDKAIIWVIGIQFRYIIEKKMIYRKISKQNGELNLYLKSKSTRERGEENGERELFWLHE